MHPSRTVTRSKCVTCGKKFQARRADARHCSGRCRQRAQRARERAEDLDVAIDEARRRYWDLIRQKAEATGRSQAEVITDESVTVIDGSVYRGLVHPDDPDKQLLGRTMAGRPGWAGWGLEAAGPPFNPPMNAKDDYARVKAALEAVLNGPARDDS
jgi:hypothetical protein